jgi:hypothetical protein
VPIWKKEQFVDGAIWADGEPFPDEQRVSGTTGRQVSESAGRQDDGGLR